MFFNLKTNVIPENATTQQKFGLMMMGLIAGALGDVAAEKFIALIKREPFDYTRWQRKLWPEKSIEDISKAAMLSRK
ncbi:MAG: hypothetical protein PHP98_06365 [Kiritimatiellae bacterium]|nr:hypothetical protein [Kiritimatiellia bacterium]